MMMPFLPRYSHVKKLLQTSCSRHSSSAALFDGDSGMDLLPLCII